MIRQWLRALLRKQERRPDLGICLNDHRRWPIALFANAGLFALHTAWQVARHCLDEETTDWRAACGKTACTVRRAGSAQADPGPYLNNGNRVRLVGLRRFAANPTYGSANV